MKSNFGARLREERENLGLDQGALADIGGINRNSQSRYETGKSFPDARYLISLAAAGGDVQYVLTGRRSDSPPLNFRLLKALVARSIQARDENMSRNLQPANLVVALYERILPVLEDGTDIEEIVDKEVTTIVEMIRDTMPERPASKSQTIEVSGDENRVAGRDFIEGKNDSQE